MKILVIIPAYNEQDNILFVIDKLKADYPEADYIVVNDCSTDGTLAVLKENNIPYLNLPQNLGIGGGIQCGYIYARDHGYDIAVQIDGDGQHDTAYLPDALAPIISGDADIVIGSRFITKEGFQSTAMRRAGIRFLSFLIRIVSGVSIADVTSGFRAVNRRFLELYADYYPVDYPEPEAIVQGAMNGAVIKEVPVVMKERISGTSSISVKRSMYYMVKVSLAIFVCRLSNKGSGR